MRNFLYSVISCLCVTQVTLATRIQPTRLPSGPTSPGREERELSYSTKIYSGVPIIVRDTAAGRGEAAGRGSSEWPLTLPPRLLQDGFAIQPSRTQGEEDVTRTEYSTFTYFITSLRGDQTVTDTDIVVSSNVVSGPASVEPTPALPRPEQISSTPFVEPPTGFQLMATKTYFTTSTFYTTYIDKERTVTRTRTSVRSSVVTDTYSGGKFDFLPGPQQTLAPSIQENPAEKYLSLGPSIYGLVRTLYTTFTYANGLGGESREVITQVSTSVFSTSALPASITAAPVPSLQLDQDTLLSLKQSHISQLSPSLTATYTQTAPLGPATTQTTTTPLPTEVDLPSGGPTLVRPTSSVGTSSSTAPPSIAPSQPDPSPAPAPSSLADQQEDGQDGSQESQEAGAGEALAGGLLGAVVGGLSSALIPPSQPPAGLQVDLGPVLDAVATLLRGPIRSAIANRRNTAAVQASERAEVGSQQTASLPQFARLPSTDPNVIPLGAAGPARPVPDRDPQYGFIPLNAPQKYNGQALPRSDTELEAEHSINDINEIPADILNILQDSNNQLDNPVVIDKDKIVINNHIIRTNDPHIIDVLNKYEHSYLYNKPVDDELKIRIAAGEPMQKPQPKPSAQPTSQNTFFGISLPKFNFGGGSRKPVQGKPSVGAGRPAGPVRRPAGRPGNPPARPAGPSHPRPSSPSIPRPSNPPPSYPPSPPT